MSISSKQVVWRLALCALMAVAVSSCGQAEQPAQPAGDVAGAPAAAGDGSGEDVPQFEFDPTFPKRLPNGWILGAIGALWVDSQDHVWIAQRPGSVNNPGDRYGFQGLSECCSPAPPVMEFDPAGNLVQAWGPLHEQDGKLMKGQTWPAEMGEWPPYEHGIAVDESDNSVWVSSYYPPMNVMKYSKDGKKHLLRIGKKWGDSNEDTENLNGPTSILPDPTNDEVFIADGYQNRRIIVYNKNTGEYKRMWGAYGKKPEGMTGGIPVEIQKKPEPYPTYPTIFEPAPADFKDDPATRSKQFATIHCLKMSRDRLLYVCDRVNNRIQVFKTDGTYVLEGVVAPRTRGWGSLHDVSFSGDPEQKFVYVADGTNKKIWILRRSDLAVIGSFSHGGRGSGEVQVAHAIGADSKGNVYVGDTLNGDRVQRFLFKGTKKMAPPATE